MKKILAGIIFAGILLAGPAFPVIYQYTDNKGQINFTNDLSSVPLDKLSDIIEIKEYESKTIPKKVSPDSGLTAPLKKKADPGRNLTIKKRVQQGKLEAEYKALQKEKKDLDSNAGYQKRRKKRKYQNRPYIQELNKKEAQIIDRLKELEAELNNLEKK